MTATSGVTGDDDDSGDHGDAHAEGDHGHAEGDHKHPEGDSEPAEGEKHEGAAGDSDAKDESASTKSSELIRFVSDKSISVPGMMCPYSCWPKVRDTLAAQPGVEAVQLAVQPEGTAEGEITQRVVELKLSGDFDVNAAVAALGKVDFAAEAIN